MTKIQMNVDGTVVASCTIPELSVTAIAAYSTSAGTTPAALMLAGLNRTIHDAVNSFPPQPLVDAGNAVVAAEAAQQGALSALLATQDS